MFKLFSGWRRPSKRDLIAASCPIKGRRSRRVGNFENLERRELLAGFNFESALSFEVDNAALEVGEVVRDAAGNAYLSGGIDINWTAAPFTIDLDPTNPDPDDPAIVGGGPQNEGGPLHLGFVAKYDATGAFQWVTTVAGEVTQLEIGNSGAIYFAGREGGAFGYGDRIAGELDASGDLVWLKQMDLAFVEHRTSGLAVDETRDRVYLTGEQMLTNPGTPSGIVVALDISNDANVTVAWTATLQATAVQHPGTNPSGVTVDSVGAVYVVGSFKGSADFDPGPGKLTLSSGSGGRFDTPGAGFVWKLLPNGGLGWAKAFPGSKNTAGAGASAVVFDGTDIVVAGSFFGTVDFDPNRGTVKLTSGGPRDIFLAKLTTGGSLVYARKYGGAGAEYVSALALDAAGDIYMTSHSASTNDFIVKFTNGGSFVGEAIIVGLGGTFSIYSVSASPGRVEVIGFFTGSVDANGDPGDAELINEENERDLFWLMYGL